MKLPEESPLPDSGKRSPAHGARAGPSRYRPLQLMASMDGPHVKDAAGIWTDSLFTGSPHGGYTGTDSLMVAEISAWVDSRSISFNLLMAASAGDGHPAAESAGRSALDSMFRTVITGMLEGAPVAGLLESGVSGAERDAKKVLGGGPAASVAAACVLASGGSVDVAGVGNLHAYVMRGGQVLKWPPADESAAGQGRLAESPEAGAAPCLTNLRLGSDEVFVLCRREVEEGFDIRMCGFVRGDGTPYSAEAAEIADRREIGLLTDLGRRREINEDSIMTADVSIKVGSESRSFKLLIVADGMGGHVKGEVASRIALGSISESVISHAFEDPAAILKGGIENADRRVKEYVENNPGAAGMGTTAVCALVDDGGVHIGNVGDSRAYRIGRDGIHGETRDHSYVQELVDGGNITEEQARSDPRRNIITRAIGSDDARPDISRIELDDDESLLLCSDGVTTHLPDGKIRELAMGGDPPDVCRRIVDTANECGGADNISLVVLSPVRPGHAGSGVQGMPLRD